MADIHCPYYIDNDGHVVLDFGDEHLRVTEPGPVIADGEGRLWVLSLGADDEEIGAFLKPLDRHADLVPFHMDDERVKKAVEAGRLQCASLSAAERAAFHL